MAGFKQGAIELRKKGSIGTPSSADHKLIYLNDNDEVAIKGISGDDILVTQSEISDISVITTLSGDVQQNASDILSLQNFQASSTNANILFDSFNEYTNIDLMFASYDWFLGVSKTFTLSTTNINLPTPKLLSDSGNSADKYWDFSKLGLMEGDKVTFSALAWSDQTDIRIEVYYRQADQTCHSLG